MHTLCTAVGISCITYVKPVDNFGGRGAAWLPVCISGTLWHTK